MSAIQETIKQLEAARDRATLLIEGLREFEEGLAVKELQVKADEVRAARPAPAARRNGKVKRSPKVNGAPKPKVEGIADKLDKPDTVAGAIKFLLRGEEKFTRAELDANLDEDPDFKKLLETSPGAADTALSAWKSRGYLTKEGNGSEAQFTVTPAGKEWFQ